MVSYIKKDGEIMSQTTLDKKEVIIERPNGCTPTKIVRGIKPLNNHPFNCRGCTPTKIVRSIKLFLFLLNFNSRCTPTIIIRDIKRKVGFL